MTTGANGRPKTLKLLSVSCLVLLASYLFSPAPPQSVHQQSTTVLQLGGHVYSHIGIKCSTDQLLNITFVIHLTFVGINIMH